MKIFYHSMIYLAIDKKYILIISQSTIGDSMADFASKLSDLLKNSKYKIVFKYHPNEMSKDYKCLKKKKSLKSTAV